MEHGYSAVGGANDSSTTRDHDAQDFPKFPGEEFHAHAASQYKEQAEARLAAHQLLAVAQGDMPISAKCHLVSATLEKSRVSGPEKTSRWRLRPTSGPRARDNRALSEIAATSFFTRTDALVSVLEGAECRRARHCAVHITRPVVEVV